MAFNMVSHLKKSSLPRGKKRLRREGATKPLWSKDDIKALKGMAHKEPLSKIAKSLKRTEGATRHKATLMGISLRMSPKKRAPLAKATKQVEKPMERSRGGFAAEFDEGFVSAERVAERFGMSKAQLAETIGVKSETFYRAARLKAPKTQARVTEMLEIIYRIANWAGSERQAVAWYRAEPIPAFGGRTAEFLVKEGKAAAVRDYLDHVATGGFA
jgi:hypothetical protein